MPTLSPATAAIRAIAAETTPWPGTCDGCIDQCVRPGVHAPKNTEGTPRETSPDTRHRVSHVWARPETRARRPARIFSLVEYYLSKTNISSCKRPPDVFLKQMNIIPKLSINLTRSLLSLDGQRRIHAIYIENTWVYMEFFNLYK